MKIIQFIAVSYEIVNGKIILKLILKIKYMIIQFQV